MKGLARFSVGVAVLIFSGATTVRANPITPQTGSTTQVNSSGSNPNQFDIKGGTKSGANLFHSFEKFGLNRGQIANFMSNPSIRNILGRVVGGDASRINSLLQVTGGNSNLFLMNPAGFVFGPNATLNIPGSFTATTANGIQIGDYWFDALGRNNYANLVGEPNGFAFVTDNPGSIVNAGNLSVPQGEQITLLGGRVINTGTIEAPGGKVTIASVPNQQLVKISQEGNLLSLGLPSTAESVLSPGVEGFTPLALPELLTGGDEPIATGVIADADGVRLTGRDEVLPTDPGTTLVAGTVDVSGPEGGTVHVLGDKVGLLGATIEASGDNRGGTVLVGGDYKGQGEVPNALRTFIDGDSVIRADALQQGPGGKVIAWADEVTAFYGDISVRGGQNSGDGGFVEVSGKEHLIFDGKVDLEATNGVQGKLLLDPNDVFISNNPSSLPEAGALSLEIDKDDFDNQDIYINAVELGKVNGEIEIQAKNNITISAPVEFTNDPSMNSSGNPANRPIIFKADADGIGGGDFVLQDLDIGLKAELNTNGRPLTIEAKNIELHGRLKNFSSSLDPRNLTFIASNNIILNPDSTYEVGSLFSPDVLTGNSLTITAGNTVFINQDLSFKTLSVTANNQIVVNGPIYNTSNFTQSAAIVGSSFKIGDVGSNLFFIANSDIQINSRLVRFNEISLTSLEGDISVISMTSSVARPSIEILDKLNLFSENGNITLGSSTNTSDINVGVNNLTGGNFVENEALGIIKAPKGDIKLFGGISISRKSILNIEAKRFQGIESTSTPIVIGSLPSGEPILATQLATT